MSTTQNLWCEIIVTTLLVRTHFCRLRFLNAGTATCYPPRMLKLNNSSATWILLKSTLWNKLAPSTVALTIMVIRAGLKRHKKGWFSYKFPESYLSFVALTMPTMSEWAVKFNRRCRPVRTPSLPSGIPGPTIWRWRTSNQALTLPRICACTEKQLSCGHRWKIIVGKKLHHRVHFCKSVIFSCSQWWRST